MNLSKSKQRRRVHRGGALAVGLAALLVAVAALIPASGSARSLAAPINLGEPTISGSAIEGQTLTATTGTWSNNPTSFTFQWLRCPASGGQPDGSDCAPIAFATSSAYTLSSSDVGFTIRVRVTASNADGSASAASNATDVVKAALSPPVNTGQPQISGIPMQGQTLTATTGTWTNNPTNYAYQWLHCPQSGGQANGSDCPPIGGATDNNLILLTRDVGFRIRVRVTATNAAGAGSAVSNPTSVVQAVSMPTNTAPPTISGRPVVGQVLTLNRGTWTGPQPISYRYEWRRCDQNGNSCLPIAGAVGLTWRILPASVGHTIRARVFATNPGGTSQLTSAHTAVITATTPPPPTAAGCPAGSGPINVNSIGSPARLLIDRQQSNPQNVQRGTQQIIVRYHVSACGGRSVQGALVYVTGVPYNQFSIPPEQRTGTDGYARLVLRRLSGFPVSNKQQLIALFVRARKQGQNVLAGISTRRLFSIHVRL
jgi:hypothetical protein